MECSTAPRVVREAPGAGLISNRDLSSTLAGPVTFSKEMPVKDILICSLVAGTVMGIFAILALWFEIFPRPQVAPTPSKRKGDDELTARIDSMADRLDELEGCSPARR